MTNLWNDLRYALRQLRKAPGFTFTAVMTLALGIGISAAMFAVVDGVLLRPLPVPHSSRLVALGEADNNGAISPTSLPNVRDWRAKAKSFQDIAWYTLKFFNMKKANGTEQFSHNVQASPNFFAMLQARPLMGRTFLPTDSATNVVVLSHNVWENNFHADKNIVGKTVQLGTEIYTVIGVMPPQWYLPQGDRAPFIWTILPYTSGMEQRDNGFLNAIGRLRPGVSMAAANAELNGIQANIDKQYGKKDTSGKVAMRKYRDTLVGSVRPALLALQGAVLVVWLIGCANIAGLLLTRMSGRRHEIAVRAALGAARGRIVQQFLTESLLLGLMGGVVGLGIAEGCLTLLHHSIAASVNRSAEVGLNWQVILMLLALSVFSAVIFGVAPAFKAASADPQDALHEGSRGAGTGAKQVRLRNTLIVSEIALSLVLLVSAGLLLRTIYALREVNLGFNPRNLVVAQFFSKNGFAPPRPGHATKDIRETMYRPLLEKVQHLPGVKSAALISQAPLARGFSMDGSFEVIGNPGANKAHRSAQFNAVTPGIYRTLGIRLLQGRTFTGQDRMGTPTVAVVNLAFAREYLGSSPLGKRLNLDTDDPATKSVMKDVTVVGIVDNTPRNNIGQTAVPEVDVDVYQPPVTDDFYPIFNYGLQLAVRTDRKPQAMVLTISRILAEHNTELMVAGVDTFQETIDRLLSSQILAARLICIFAMAALLIAAAGLYGLLSYGVSQRTREIGLRIALGAQREDILRMILRQATRLLGMGILLGVLGSYFATRLVRSFLYGVDPHDWLTIVVVSILLIGVGLLASYIPARRASRIEPTEALRTE
ncbi:MAG: ABC transporter permease [Acidobacteriaceae bacterium]